MQETSVFVKPGDTKYSRDSTKWESGSDAFLQAKPPEEAPASKGFFWLKEGVECVNLKNIHNLKVESYFFWWEFLGLQTQKTVSQINWENSSEEMEGARLYRSFITKWAGSLNIKSLLLMKENQLSQVKKFRLFSVCKDARIWAHWNHFFDIYLSYLGPVSCFQILSFLSSGLTVGIGCSLRAGILPEFPQISPAHHCGGCNCWGLWPPCLLTWQEIFHFSNGTLWTAPLGNTWGFEEQS